MSKALKETIEVLIMHNDWRRGKEVDMQTPENIGVAIDHAISVLMQVENLIRQKGRHNTDIAYRGLENAAGGQ